jgi:colicin import membrane protein
MSTVREPKPSRFVPPRKDPFRYGWRYVRRVLPDGTKTLDQVPLTLEDVLHPQVGDFHVLTDEHNDDCAYLKYALRKQLAGKAMVLSDHRIAWDRPGVEPHGPDIAVIFGLRQRKRPGPTFYVATEGARPKLIIEVTSQGTRRNDVVIKVDEYYRAGVLLYVIVDVRHRRGKRIGVELIGYRRGPTGYEKMPLDERGWLWLEELGVWIGIEGTRVVCYDRRGRKILDYAELADAREAEAKARKAAEEQAKVAEAQAKAAERRAKNAEARAKKEAEAREALEAQNRELQERLRRLETRRQPRADSTEPED